MTDLFGHTYTEEDLAPKPKTLIRTVLGGLNYRRATGTARCKNCANSIHVGAPEWTRRYWKCRLVGCSASAATDIRANNVCDAWEEDVEEA